MKVYEEIIRQLGGNRFCAMTGAKNFVAGESSIHFSIGRGAKNKCNKVAIALAGDLYEVKFYNIRGVNVKCVGEFEGVYGDKLAPLFEQETGFDTRM